jgi:hypothetical protein
MAELINANPTVYMNSAFQPLESTLDFDDEDAYEPISPKEVYQHIRNLSDPEHPLTLEQLHVVNEEHVTVEDGKNSVLVQFTPTIPHCSMATLIGKHSRSCAGFGFLASLLPFFFASLLTFFCSFVSSQLTNLPTNYPRTVDKSKVDAIHPVPIQSPNRSLSRYRLLVNLDLFSHSSPCCSSLFGIYDQ